MTPRSDLLQSITKTIADYRKGEIPKPTPDHVDKWVSQFKKDIQLTLLKELDNILDETYFSKKWVNNFVSQLVKQEKLAGTNYCDFWQNANILEIQQRGRSQKEMLEVFSEALHSQCDIYVDDCGSDQGPYIYIDDALFSGFHVGDDLEQWLEDEAPDDADVHILMIAIYSYGVWKTKKRLTDKAKELGKKIRFNFWRAIELENNPSRSSVSEIFWPANLPENELIKAYIAEKHKFPFKPRQSGGTCEHKIFTCEEGRQLIENELLLAGLKIRSYCANPKDIMRPLGFSPFGLGFGATVITFRNCSNNCPLALWWGDPNAEESHPFSKWYPLLPRKTNHEDIKLGGIIFE